MPGPMPKPRALRQRQNRITTAAQLEAAPATRVDLPEGEWHPHTLSWWSTIWDSPMAGEWVDADVPGLVSLAALVDKFWLTLDAKIAAEIRMQQREYGLSPLARRMLQWEIAKGEQAVRKVAASRPSAEPVADPRKTLRALA